MWLQKKKVSEDIKDSVKEGSVPEGGKKTNTTEEEVENWKATKSRNKEQRKQRRQNYQNQFRSISQNWRSYVSTWKGPTEGQAQGRRILTKADCYELSETQGWKKILRTPERVEARHGEMLRKKKLYSNS